VSRANQEKKMKIRHFAPCAAIVLTASLMSPSATQAESAADFYRGKTITFLVGSGAGGSYDIYARALAAHLPKHIPGNPKIVVKLTGGSGAGLPAAIQMQSTVARDGTVFSMTQQTIVVSQVIETVSAGKFDVRTWHWMGLMAPVRNMLAVWHTAPAQTLEAAREHEVVIGASARTSPTYIVPKIVNEIYGTKFKIVLGYRSAQELNIAMERGETQGRGASWLSVITQAPDYITQKKLKALVVDGLTKEPTLPGVPRLMDLASTPEQRQAVALISSAAEFGRAVFLPPDTPADRVDAMRRAFDATMKDPEFLAEAQKRKVPIVPQSGETLDRLAADVVSASAPAVKLARELMGTD
jgi:tripartite-type tricarboxylate transporter receptor subunit TctC